MKNYILFFVITGQFFRFPNVRCKMQAKNLETAIELATRKLMRVYQAKRKNVQINLAYQQVEIPNDKNAV